MNFNAEDEMGESENEVFMEKVLQNCENDLTIKIDRVECEAGSRQGDNYMSLIKRATVYGKRDDLDYQRKLIVKRQISSISRRQLFRCDEAFANEIAAYTKVLPLLRRFSGNRLPYPRCLFAGVDEHQKEAIILEDLCESAFEMEDRLKGLDYPRCSLVIQELGNLHAISLAMKTCEPKTFNKARTCISEIVYCPEAREVISNTLEGSLRDSLASLRATNAATPDSRLTLAIGKIERMQNSMYEIMCEHVLAFEESWNVICHGDVWINNLMFRRSQGGDVEQVKLVDLQTMRCASPVIDILHFIYTSTVRDFRHSNLDQLIRDYRGALVQSLQVYLSGREEALSRWEGEFSVENIKRELKRKMLYALGNSMWLMPAVTFHPNRIPDLNAVTITDFGKNEHMSQMLTPEYHKRIQEMVLEFHEEGVLDGL
ncbi:uncharacterized protein DMENIID0001_067710 [Sergentomyia squamirostris]